MTDNFQKPVRVRFGPSPTGFLHIGSARTTLFNWLFAKKYDGKFILRVEDTDIERSKKEYEEDIVKGLKWLGLNWDEGPDIGGNYGPYRQSERVNIYEKYLKKLLDEDKAYYCFCLKEDLEADRQAMLSQGIAPKYSGKCRHLSRQKSEEKIKKEKGVIRFKMPLKISEFNDLIRGKIKFDTALIGDIVIAKGLKEPLYNFSVAIDDYEMKISHVIRGEDHLANTPKQIAIFEAIEAEPPQYAHLPLILAPDRSKMSKRYMETSLNEYKELGYLTEALINFLALLGWHPEDEKEILSRDELIEKFDLKRIQKAGAIFNIEKLDWLNSQYIKKIDNAELMEQIKNFIPENWRADENILIKAIMAEKERIKKLADFKELAGFFFELEDYESKLLIWRSEPAEKIISNLKTLAIEIDKITETAFNKESIERMIMPLVKNNAGEFLWPLRAALSGKQASPGPFEILEILGKKESLKRLEIAVEKLKKQ